MIGKETEHRGFSVNYGANPKDANFSKIGEFELIGTDRYQWQVSDNGKIMRVLIIKGETLAPKPLFRHRGAQ